MYWRLLKADEKRKVRIAPSPGIGAVFEALRDVKVVILFERRAEPEWTDLALWQISEFDPTESLV